MSAITIRPERAGDEAVIHELTEAAFRDMPFSEGDEQELVDALRNDGDLTLSLVAEDGMRIVGHIAFSPVAISAQTCRPHLRNRHSRRNHNCRKA